MMLWMVLITTALFATGVGGAVYGQRNLEPEIAYISAFFIAAAIVMAGITAFARMFGII